jgi:hypothetical protein
MKHILVLLTAVFLISCATDEDILEEININQTTLFIIAGQSNAAGVGDSEDSIIRDFPCYEYTSILGSYITLEDPGGQNELGFQKAFTGSFAPSLAYSYSELTGEEVYVVQTARGGSSLVPAAETIEGVNWSDGGDLLSNSLLKIDFAIDTLPNANAESTNIVLVWSQGENDGLAIGEGVITVQQYELGLINLINRYTNKYGPTFSFVIIETGRHATCESCDVGNGLVRETQQRVAASLPNTYIGYNKTKDFIELDWLKDPVHYNQEALNDIGNVVANFIAQNIL